MITRIVDYYYILDSFAYDVIIPPPPFSLSLSRNDFMFFSVCLCLFFLFFLSFFLSIHLMYIIPGLLFILNFLKWFIFFHDLCLRLYTYTLTVYYVCERACVWAVSVCSWRRYYNYFHGYIRLCYCLLHHHHSLCIMLISDTDWLIIFFIIYNYCF